MVVFSDEAAESDEAASLKVVVGGADKRRESMRAGFEKEDQTEAMTRFEVVCAQKRPRKTRLYTISVQRTDFCTAGKRYYFKLLRPRKK